MELDIVPIVFNIKPYHTDSATRINIKHRIGSATGSFAPSGAETPTVFVDHSVLGQTGQVQGLLSPTGVQQKLPISRTIDEQADEAARKAIMHFGPGNNPRLSIGPRNQVAVDAAGKIHLIDDLDAYRNSVGEGTWNAVIQLADELREKKVKIGFFSSTPQGGESNHFPQEFEIELSFLPLSHFHSRFARPVLRWCCSRECLYFVICQNHLLIQIRLSD